LDGKQAPNTSIWRSSGLGVVWMYVQVASFGMLIGLNLTLVSFKTARIPLAEPSYFQQKV